jgi:uncharacterized protein YndB with AHSA1/START domain
MMISIDLEQSINARVTRRFSASPQRVFDAWLDSRTAGKWLFATASGQIACVEIDRPHRLVFTLFVEKYSLDFERVTVVLDPRGTGCELTLTHKTKPELARQVSHGWIRMLEGLAAVLGESSRVAPPREIAEPRRGHERMA